MSANCSESVETMTSPKMPLSLAAAMVYAMTGWPPNGLMFLFLTRLEPARAGIRPTMLGVRSRGMGLPLVGEECTPEETGARSQESGGVTGDDLRGIPSDP